MVPSVKSGQVKTVAKSPVTKVHEWVAKATGISLRTVKNIAKKKKFDSGETFEFMSKKEKVKKKKLKNRDWWFWSVHCF